VHFLAGVAAKLDFCNNLSYNMKLFMLLWRHYGYIETIFSHGKGVRRFFCMFTGAVFFMSCKESEESDSLDTRARIPFNVPSEYTWDEAVSAINSADAGNTFLINLTADIAVPGIAGSASASFKLPELDVWIKGSRTIALETPGRLLNIQGENQLITVEDVTLKGLSHAAGDPEDNTSEVVRIQDGALAKRGAAAVTGNTGDRAAIYVAGSGSLDIRDTVRVFGNTGGTGRGGGIFLTDKAIARIGGDAEVSGNVAANNGGGICCWSGNAAVIIEENAKIAGNIAHEIGGVGTEHGLIILKDNAAITGNTTTATGGGGVIAWSDGRLYISGGTINGYDSGHSVSLHNPQNSRDDCNIVWRSDTHQSGNGAAINVADSQGSTDLFNRE
jgi:predicted outer membrane repeat protein